MAKRGLIGGLGIGGLLLGGLAGSRRLIDTWAENPDPLSGHPVRFPDGEARTVELADGAVIHTVTAGSGPVIVLVHGVTTSSHDWGPVAEHLVASGFQVVGIDQRGHGQSTVGTAGFGSRQLGRDLRDVFDVLDIHARALVGHSMGGMAAMAFATEHRDTMVNRVARLVLVATSSELQNPRHKLALGLGSVSLPDAVRAGGAQMRLGAGAVFGSSPSLHMVDEVIAAFQQTPEVVRVEALTALKHHDVRDELGNITAPTLVIGGGRDRLIFPDQVAALDAGISTSTLTMFPEAGHMLIWERHREISDMIIDFVTPKTTAAPDLRLV